MEEAERLCDRLAVIDAGRIAALGTPAELIATVGAEQRIRFRPSQPVDDTLFTGLPEVREVRHHGTQLEVIGEGNLLHAVTSVLATNHIIAADLRVEQADLDDAYVRLTGRAGKE
jgi:ABC-2 type transport system ATP-binding protein